MQAFKLLGVINGLLLVASGLFAFISTRGITNGGIMASPVGLTYAAILVMIPLVTAACIGGAWFNFRTGNLKLAQWIAGLPLAMLVCCLIVLIGFHLASSLTLHPS